MRGNRTRRNRVSEFDIGSVPNNRKGGRKRGNLAFEITVDPFLDPRLARIGGIEANAEELIGRLAPAHGPFDPNSRQSEQGERNLNLSALGDLFRAFQGHASTAQLETGSGELPLTGNH